ncbi:hypothetical protein K438DRAFT_1952849 [Mycena galopus ATCC 62051]|nr:hypothetical protein K438DRAFT_1952849 [Mycena galopus ATCC 62051]
MGKDGRDSKEHEGKLVMLNFTLLADEKVRLEFAMDQVARELPPLCAYELGQQALRAEGDVVDNASGAFRFISFDYTQPLPPCVCWFRARGDQSHPHKSQVFHPDPSILRNSKYVPSPRSAPSLPLTNAKRLQPGLPLKKPTRRNPAKAAIAKRSALPPVSVTTNIWFTTSELNIAYLAPQLNDYGVYGYARSIPSAALSVTFSYDPTNPSAIFDFLGAFVGNASTSNDLGPGSSNYNYLGGTVQTPAGSPPTNGGSSWEQATGDSKPIESAIASWSYDPVTTLLTPHWTNTDGSVVAPSILYVPSTSGFLITGDPAAFRAKFDPSSIDVAFSLEPV